MFNEEITASSSLSLLELSKKMKKREKKYVLITKMSNHYCKIKLSS